MNTQERERLTRFLQDLVQARPAFKDAEAERLIRENCNYQPDAAYLLVQRVLLLEEATKNAQAENLSLRKELAEVRGNGGIFLNDSAWGNSPQVPARAADATATAAPTPAATPIAGAAASPGSSMFGTVATTAAGVVAGSLLFQGIENLMGNSRGSGFISSDTSRPAELAREDAGVDDFGSGNDFSSLVPSESDLDSV